MPRTKDNMEEEYENENENEDHDLDLDLDSIMELLEKKIRKVHRLMNEILYDQGETAGRASKAYKKLEKKLKQYKEELDDLEEELMEEMEEEEEEEEDANRQRKRNNDDLDNKGFSTHSLLSIGSLDSIMEEDEEDETDDDNNDDDVSYNSNNGGGCPKNITSADKPSKQRLQQNHQHQYSAKILRKKLHKVEKMLTDIAGSKTNTSKVRKKLETKRQEYISQLEEMGELMMHNDRQEITEDEESKLKLAEEQANKADAEQEHKRQEEADEQQKQAEVEAQARAFFQKSKQEEQSQHVKLLKKKLAKVERLLEETPELSKDHQKYLKKRCEYLAALEDINRSSVSDVPFSISKP